MVNIMANGRVITGFSHPMYQKRNNTTAGSGQGIIARGVDVSIDIDTADDIIFYADNGAAETITGLFNGGTLTLTVDGLNDNIYPEIFSNVTEVEDTSEPPVVIGYDFSKENNSQHCAVGFVIRTISGGTTKYHYCILPKVIFKVPDEEASTQEEDIDFQTMALEASIYAEDEPDTSDIGCWKFISQEYATEALAITALGMRLSNYANRNNA